MSPNPKAPTRAVFAQGMIAALRAEGVAGEPTWDELENTLRYPDGTTFSLEENYLEAELQPAYLLDQLLTAYAHQFVHPPTAPERYEDARAVLFPWIRPMAFHASNVFQRSTGKAIKDVPFAPITPHVIACIGTPQPRSTLPVTVQDLQRWGITLEEALTQARENVAARKREPWQASPEHPGVYRSNWKDAIGVGRVLVRDIFRDIPLRGDPVLIITTWQTLYVAGADDTEGLLNLTRLAKSHLSTNHGGLCLRPLRARGGTFEHWLPPKGHGAHAALRFLQAAGECGDYADQSRAMVRHLERQEKPANIPAPQVFEVPGGSEAGSIVTWRDGPPCSLPKVDYVIFKSKGQTLGVTTWDDVRRVLGSELLPLGVYPARWLVEHFPEPLQISELNLRPIDQRPGRM